MKTFRIVHQIKALIILMCIIFVCTRDIPNPILESFNGDYRFNIQWDSLTQKDTLEIFHCYWLPFKVIGIDIFSTFRITDSNNVVIADTNGYQPLNSDSIIGCYFTKPFYGNIYIRGIRPNNKEVVKESPMPLTIINPFRVDVDSIHGMRTQHVARVQKWYNSSIIPESLSTIWDIGGVVDTVAGLTKNYITTKSNFSVNTTIVDAFNNRCSFDSIFVITSGISPEIDTVIITQKPYLGEPCSFTLFTEDKDSTSFQLFAEFNKKTLFSQNPIFQYNRKTDVVTQNVFTDTGNGSLSVFLTDSSGLKSNIFTCSLFIGYTLPVPVFDSSRLTIPIDEYVTIRIHDTNATNTTRYRWQILQLGIDSTTQSDSFSVKWSDTVQDTVIISGMDSNGYQGPFDTLVVNSRSHSYTLHKTLFPSKIHASVLATFQVHAKDEKGAAVNDNIAFQWIVGNESMLDSVYRNRDTLKIRTDKESDTCTIAVRAVINGSDTTNTITGDVIAIKQPMCVFTQSSYYILAGDTTTFSVNPGTVTEIDSIYMEFDAKIIELGKETSYSSVFFLRDTIIAYTWAVAHGGVKTGVDSAEIIVYSNPPKFCSNTGGTVVSIYDTVTISVQGCSGNPNSIITNYFWDLNGDYIWDDTTAVNYYKLTVDTSMNDTIHVGCIDDFGDTAIELFHFHLIVNIGSPIIDRLYCDTTWAFINERINLFATATDSNGTISSLYVDTNSDGQGDIIIKDINRTNSTNTVPLFFPQPGMYNISVWVDDDDKNVSPACSLSIPITIDQGQPRITGVTPDTVFVKDNTSFTISALDNKKIGEYEWSFTSTHFNLLGSVNSFTHSFSDSGWHRFYTRVKDNENNYSLVFPDSVYVIWAAPHVDNVSPDTVWINDLNEFTIYFHDINDSVETMMLNWGDGSANMTIKNLSGNRTVQHHSYPETSDTNYTVTVTVVDNDTITSSKSFSIHVREGKPTLRSISIDTTHNNLFIMDKRKYRIQAFDLNGYINKIHISFDGDNDADSTIIFSYQASSVDTFITHSYNVTNSGNQKIQYWIEDDDNLVSELKDTTVYVRLSPPVLWGNSDDTVWVADTNDIGISATDTNGLITKTWVDWDMNGIWDDSTTLTKKFSYSWDTAFGGKFVSFKARVMDDDSLINEKVCSVFVRMGRPRVWADGDTLYIPSNTGMVTFYVNSFDTNGTIVYYQFDRLADGKDLITVQDSFLNYDLIFSNREYLWSVYVKDDDSLFGIDTFYVYPDSAPPAVNQIFPIRTSPAFNDSESVVFEWTGIDKRDGLATEFQVEVQMPDQIKRTVISPFKEATGYTTKLNDSDIWHFKFIYTPVSWTTGSYKWWVKSRDSLGSVSESTEESFFHN